MEPEDFMIMLTMFHILCQINTIHILTCQAQTAHAVCVVTTLRMDALQDQEIPLRHTDRLYVPPSLLFRPSRGALSLGFRQPGCEADNSSPSNAEVKNEQRCNSSSSTRLHGVGREDLTFPSSNYTFYLNYHTVPYLSSQCVGEWGRLSWMGRQKILLWKRLTGVCYVKNVANELQVKKNSKRFLLGNSF